MISDQDEQIFCGDCDKVESLAGNFAAVFSSDDSYNSSYMFSSNFSLIEDRINDNHFHINKV